MSNYIFTIIFLLSVSLPCSAQKSPAFFKDNFVFNKQVYAIEIENNHGSFKFNILLNGKTKSFSLYSLDSPESVRINMDAKIKELIEQPSNTAFVIDTSRAIELLFTNIVENKDSSFRFSIEQQIDFNKLIDTISSKGQCASFDKNLKFNQIIEKAVDSTKIKLLQAQLACKNNSKPKSIIDYSSIPQIVENILDKARIALRINTDDASIATKTYLNDSIGEVRYALNTRDCQNLLWKLNSKSNNMRSRIDKRKGKIASKPNAIRFWSKKSIEKLQQRKKTLDDTIAVIQHRCDSLRRFNTLDYFKPDSAQLEFENGMLLNAKVIGTLNIGDSIEMKEIFHNNLPIPLSTKTASNFLFRGENIGNFYLTSAVNHLTYEINLSNVFFNDYNLLPLTENYAPKDQVVTILPNGLPLNIYKEKNKEILKARVFTDLVGLKENRPNGLVQMEFSKKLNLVSRILSAGRVKSRNYVQYLNYIEPMFLISKIEDTNDKLNIKSSTFAVPDTTVTVNTVSFNDILRYRKSALGTRLNLFYIGQPGLQSNIHINAISNFSLTDLNKRTSRIDSVGNSTTAVLQDSVITLLSLDYGFEAIMDINPSDKYQLRLSAAPRWTKIFSNNSDFFPLSDEESTNKLKQDLLNNTENKLNKDIGQRTKFYLSFELLATAKLNTNGELFFRGRYQFLGKDASQNFFQIQTGFSFFFLGKNK